MNTSENIDAYVASIVSFVQNEVKRGATVTHITRDEYSMYCCHSHEVLIEKLKEKLPSQYEVDLGHTAEVPAILYIRW